MTRLETLKQIIEEYQNKKIKPEEVIKRTAEIACKMDLTETERIVSRRIQSAFCNRTGVWKKWKDTQEHLQYALNKVEEMAEFDKRAPFLYATQL